MRRRAGDASLPEMGPTAALELARLLTRLAEYTPRPRIHPAARPLIDFLAPDATDDAERIARARAANPGLGMIIGALVTNVIVPTVVDAAGPTNVVIAARHVARTIGSISADATAAA